MLTFYLHHCCIAILPKFQLPFPVDTEETAQHLRHKIQHIPVCLNVILRVDGKHLRPVRHGFNLCLRMCQFHVTGFTAQRKKRIGIPHRLKPIETFLKPEHVIICFQFQTVRRPVCFTYLKNPHRHFLKAAVRCPQMVGKLYLCILQSITVNLRKQGDSHLRCIHRAKLDLCTSTALHSNIAAAFHDILIPKRIFHPGFCRDLSCPVILSGILLHRLQERFADWIHENTPFHTKGTSHF